MGRDGYPQDFNDTTTVHVCVCVCVSHEQHPCSSSVRIVEIYHTRQIFDGVY